MRWWRSILTALMILWLPLQGFAAVAMPFCKHGFYASAHSISQSPPAHAETRHVHSHAQSASDSHRLHANTHQRDGSLTCNDCGVCHLACSPLAPTSLNPIERVCAQSFMQFSPALPPAFFPEQQTPPPLGAIV
jgi:hypothetical protein